MGVFLGAIIIQLLQVYLTFVLAEDDSTVQLNPKKMNGLTDFVTSTLNLLIGLTLFFGKQIKEIEVVFWSDKYHFLDEFKS